MCKSIGSVLALDPPLPRRLRLQGIQFFLDYLLHDETMETEGPFVKVPIECVSQVFRKTRKTVSEC